MITKKVHFTKVPRRLSYWANRTYDIQADKAEEYVSKGYGTFADPKLPDDFPQRELLMSAGLDSVQAVAEFGDLTDIKGIGKAAAEKILDYLTK